MGKKIRDLHAGTSGPDVKAVQRTLKDWGVASLHMPETGVFHGETERAVRVFQEQNQLMPNGIIDSETRLALYPVGVATVTLLGMRLKKPELVPRPGVRPPTLLPGNLKLDSLTQMSAQLLKLRPEYELTRLPGLSFAMPVPKIPDYLLSPPAPASKTPFEPFGFTRDHSEVQPGTSTALPFGGKLQNMFTLTAQTIYRRGPADAGHAEATPGLTASGPVTNPSSGLTITPFIQLTDVDRFGTLGHFHYWQPFGQAGVQFGGPGTGPPQLTLSLTPLNFTLDLLDNLSVNAGAGLAFNMDLKTGQVTAGAQFTAGITFKFDTVP